MFAFAVGVVGAAGVVVVCCAWLVCCVLNVVCCLRFWCSCLMSVVRCSVCVVGYLCIAVVACC